MVRFKFSFYKKNVSILSYEYVIKEEIILRKVSLILLRFIVIV